MDRATAAVLNSQEYLRVLKSLPNVRDLSRDEYNAIVREYAMVMYPEKKWTK